MKISLPSKKKNKLNILDLYTNMIQLIEQKEKFSCIVLDFANACDTVDQYILIRKPEYYESKA